ncbi:hypothetical protein E3P98_03397 [Wallemia ichthyophaga]|uniref:Mediator of RNA polymerase II transcription subunit 17 n=1 Tax=Wallemia ichthyophaga TaxID=245174 RepID=A0A4T0EXC8_WALIC|nr:hypothetical protein E3P98_03397 [Wallemia ichthyophaga]TIB38736.1 hypothetical protein E3P86_01472 [Wallemia ichthyophaga]
MSISLENEGYHGDKDLVDIPESGEPIYDEPLDGDTQFARTLHRIWQEKGDFSQVSSKSLLQDQLNELNDVDKQSEPEDDTRNDESLSVDDVLKLKHSVLTNLDDAKNELAVALDVVNLLLSNTPRHENTEIQLPIPKHSLGTAAINASELTPLQALKKSKIAITTKNESLQSAANIFDRASEQTEQTNAQNAQFWDDCLLLRDRNWTLIPSNAKSESTTDLEKAAKDLKVLYSVDEGTASNEIKHDSIASLDIKISQSNDFNLSIPKRRNRRLKLSIRSGNHIETSSAFRSNVEMRNTSDNVNERIDSLLRTLDYAQSSSFEEDLFASLLNEANQIPIVITSSAEMIVIELDTSSQLVLELVNGDDYIEEGEEISSKCDGLLLGVKLLQIRSYKNISAKNNQVLKPILDLLHYEAFTESIKGLLGRITDLLCYVEVKEASYHVQKTYTREVLDIFLNNNKPQTIGSQGRISFGKQ